jgi:serine/threonine-protein kinase
MPEVQPDDDHRAQARAAREALIGKNVAGRYVLRGLVGHGGMGAVYEAEHLGLGKRFAIKFIDQEFATDDQVVKRFAREARAMSTIESAHIVTVFDSGAEEGRPYLVMELLRGEDLGQRLRRTRTVPLKESLHIIAQVLKGLARAHGAGIVHRDLKPDNVFLTRTDTDPLFAKIVDFGISKIDRPRAATAPMALTGRGTIIGTPLYMSPEQAQCATDVDGRADLYSAGAILFECLSGRPPHTGESYEQVILSIVMREAPDVRVSDPKIPEEVSNFLKRALSRDRDQRFASAERMLAALHEIAPEERARVPLDPPAPKTLVSAGVPTGDAEVPSELARVADERPVAMTKVGMGGLDEKGAPILSTSAPDTEKMAPSTRKEGGAKAAAPPGDATITDAVWSQRNAPSISHPDAKQITSSSISIPGVGPKRKLAPVIATAALATATGIAAMFGIIYVTGKSSDPPRGLATASSAPVVVSSSPEVTLKVPPESASAAPPPPPTPSASSAASHATAATKTPTLPALPPSSRPTATKPPGTTKPLDINRDLP